MLYNYVIQQERLKRSNKTDSETITGIPSAMKGAMKKTKGAVTWPLTAFAAQELQRPGQISHVVGAQLIVPLDTEPVADTTNS